MVCDADESPAQTKAVIRQNWGQKWLTLIGGGEIETWRDFQRWLEFDAPYDVVVPFGEAIYGAFVDLLERTPAVLQLRMRRDSGAFLTAIKSSAVLHKARRQTDSQGRIVAELADYRHAWNAFNQSMAGLYGVKVRPEVVAIAKAAEELGAALYIPESHLHDDHTDSVKITIGMMRQALGINSNDVADNRIKEALDAGVLKQDEARKGGRGSPRYFWLLRTSRELQASAQLGVFPAPSAVKNFLVGGGGRKQTDKKEKTIRLIRLVRLVRRLLTLMRLPQIFPRQRRPSRRLLFRLIRLFLTPSPLPRKFFHLTVCRVRSAPSSTRASYDFRECRRNHCSRYPRRRDAFHHGRRPEDSLPSARGAAVWKSSSALARTQAGDPGRSLGGRQQKFVLVVCSFRGRRRRRRLLRHV
jgi:hypothetical protein